jgi:SAM-dependent methyltransferase
VRFGKVDIVRSSTMRALESPRVYLAARYLEGAGIEIGALNRPTLLPSKCRIMYLDRMGTATLQAQYPEIPAKEIQHVDIVGNCERLDLLSLPELDFIIANHFLEHCQDPIGTLASFVRVLRPQGKIYLAIPNRVRTFDSERSPTPPSHFLNDFRDGGASSRHEHYEEWVSQVNHVSEAQTPEKVQELMDADYSIHFHVWTPNEFLQFVDLVSRSLSIELEIVACLENDGEFLVVLRT